MEKGVRMKSSGISFILAIVAGALVALWAVGAPALPAAQFVQPGCDLSSLRPSQSWCAMSEPNSNAYYLWRSSPLQLLAPAALEEPYRERLVFSLVLFSGLILVLFSHALSPREQGLGIITAALGTGFIVEVLGGDRVALSSLSLLPWTLALLERLTDRPSLVSKSMLLAGTFLLISTANQMAPVVMGTAILLQLCFDHFRRTAGEELRVSTAVERSFVAGLFLLTLGALLTIPQFSVPWYPQGTQVVPDDEIPGMLRPFWGPLPPVPFINRFALKELLVPNFHLLLVTAALVAIALGARRRERSLLLVISGIPLSFLYFDLRAPESMSIISPLLVIPRLIPHLFFFPLETLALGTAALGIVFTLLVRPSFLGVLILGMLSFFGPKIFPPSLTKSPTSVSAPLGQWADSALFERHLKLLSSPSQFVLSAHQWDALGQNRNWILERENLIRTGKFRTLGPDEVTISASQHAEALPQLFSKSDDSRWTAGQGRQKGNEWIRLRFAATQKLDGIELFLGPYVTDFPRGVRISAAAYCGAEEAPREDAFSTVVDYPEWYGSLEFTPQGLPFFRGRYSVKIYFPKTIEASCFLIQQTGKDEGSDWSIARIRVL